MSFNVGDRVRLIKQYGTFGPQIGWEGNVVKIRTSNWIGVEWDQMDTQGHNCDGACQDGKGLYVERNTIELVEPNPPSQELAWWIYRDQLGRSPSTREKLAFEAGYRAGTAS